MSPFSCRFHRYAGTPLCDHIRTRLYYPLWRRSAGSWGIPLCGALQPVAHMPCRQRGDDEVLLHGSLHAPHGLGRATRGNLRDLRSFWQERVTYHANYAANNDKIGKLKKAKAFESMRKKEFFFFFFNSKEKTHVWRFGFLCHVLRCEAGVWDAWSASNQKCSFQSQVGPETTVKSGSEKARACLS